MYLPIATPPVKVTRSTSRVGEQLVGDLARVAGDDRQHLRRQAGFVQDVGEAAAPRAASSRWASAPSGCWSRSTGATLCATWFSGWLNGVIAEIDAEQRLAQRVDAALLAVRREVAGEDLAVVASSASLAANEQHVAGAADFVERVLLAEPRLGA